MSSIYGILNMAGYALMTHQQAIHITGNNIANVNTPGYSRQRLLLTNDVHRFSAYGPIGNGVKALGTERVYDRFIGVQINNESQNLGRWEAHKQILEGVEVIFDESHGYGLSQAMSEFWNAWQDVSNNPSGQTERLVLVSKGEVLAAVFNQKYEDLKAAQQGIDANINGAIEQINQLTTQIADLNQKIIETELTGKTADAFRDQRDLALRQLSELTDINTFEEANGAVKISISGELTLVEGDSHRHLRTQTNSSGLADILWVGSDGSTIDISGKISGGKLKGWLDARDVTITDYISRLDMLADKIMEEVNLLHSTGYGLDNSTGYDFFSGTDLSDMQVNPAIANDVDLIAAAADLSGVPGDNSNAIAIANLKNKLTMGSGATTFDDFYNAMVSDVGSEVLKMGAYHSHQFDMVAYLDNYRESISGVSLDEEMVNLVKFQSAYDASAKLISTTDELIKTILDMI